MHFKDFLQEFALDIALADLGGLGRSPRGDTMVGVLRLRDGVSAAKLADEYAVTEDSVS